MRFSGRKVLANSGSGSSDHWNSSPRNTKVEHLNNRRPFEDPLDLFPRGLKKVYSIWVSKTYPFASIGHNVSFHFTSKLSRQRAGRISLGDSVSIGEHAWLN